MILDYRESGLAKLLPQFKLDNLIHGDACIHDYIIERKSIQDLCSSIKDSRFREQKSRLLAVYPPEKIVYIIEGDKKTKYDLPESTIRSAILNLIFKHKFKVVFSKSIEDTAKILVDISTKLELDGKYGGNEIGYTPIKKSDISLENALACQLATIPGVSPGVATLLQEKYSTMKNLINEFQDPLGLASIQVSEKRKLGPKLSTKIYNALNVQLVPSLE